MTDGDSVSRRERRGAADAEGLAAGLAAILDPLGGVTAVSVRRVGGRGIPLALARPAHGADDDERPAPQLPPGAVVALRADLPLPAASLAKLPVAVEVLRRADLGQFALDERVDTSEEPRVGGAGVLDFLNPATRLTLGDLCTLMLVVSDNTAANFLLDFVGMGEINETIARMNLRGTRLARRFMDAAARAARRENTTSADDMTTLLGLVRAGALPGARRLMEMLAAQQSFPELAEGYLPPHARIAHKDGTLDDAVHDAGVLTGPDGTAIYCVLTTEQRDIPAARTAVARCIRLIWDAWCDPR